MSLAHALMLDIPSALMCPMPSESEPGTLAPSFPNYTGSLRVIQVFSHLLNPDSSQMSFPNVNLVPELST